MAVAEGLYLGTVRPPIGFTLGDSLLYFFIASRVDADPGLSADDDFPMSVTELYGLVPAEFGRADPPRFGAVYPDIF